MTHRMEIYRPNPDRTEAYMCAYLWTDARAPLLTPKDMLPGSRPGTFALVIRVDGPEETVLERWRVDEKGRVLRAVYDVRTSERLDRT